MFEIEGNFNKAYVHAATLDSSAVGQLKAICDQEYTSGLKLHIMPDAHAGMGCVVGTTMTIADKVVPNFVGVDIGCGMEVVNFGDCEPDFAKLDKVIRNRVPHGSSTRRQPHRFTEEIRLGDLTDPGIIDMKKAMLSVGTLGSGNHFIEIGHDEKSGDYFLIIHSGSRKAGLDVAKHHQREAAKGKPEEIPFPLAYVSGEKMDRYLNDMGVMVDYANTNRRAMADEIMDGMGWKAKDSFCTIHNYIDRENMILRKGAVSAQKGERLLIPLNMRDGSLICEGLGNPDWNYSAPHGAGRAYSRKDAREKLDLDQFKKEMEGIYTTCVSNSTLDESPEAYKPSGEIIDELGETAKIVSHLKTVYNFKAPC